MKGKIRKGFSNLVKKGRNLLRRKSDFPERLLEENVEIDPSVFPFLGQWAHIHSTGIPVTRLDRKGGRQLVELWGHPMTFLGRMELDENGKQQIEYIYKLKEGEYRLISKEERSKASLLALKDRVVVSKATIGFPAKIRVIEE
ncbi:MAG: hypothetical protein ABIA76_06215 [Candidatus Diapherotrites archaeon]